MDSYLHTYRSGDVRPCQLASMRCNACDDPAFYIHHRRTVPGIATSPVVAVVRLIHRCTMLRRPRAVSGCGNISFGGVASDSSAGFDATSLGSAGLLFMQESRAFCRTSTTALSEEKAPSNSRILWWCGKDKDLEG